MLSNGEPCVGWQVSRGQGGDGGSPGTSSTTPSHSPSQSPQQLRGLGSATALSSDGSEVRPPPEPSRERQERESLCRCTALPMLYFASNKESFRLEQKRSLKQ